MDNVLETQGVPLTVFGGAVPELAPEDLPEGASPFNQDVDFSPGSVFTRGGRANQIIFQNLFVEKICGTAITIADPGSVGETPWTTPTNATQNNPPNYASVLLQAPGSFPGVTTIDQGTTGGTTSTVSTFATGTINPQVSNEYAIFAIQTAVNSFTSGSFTTFNGAASQTYGSPFTAVNPLAATGTFAGPVSGYGAVMISAFTDGNAPTTFNSNHFSQADSTGNPRTVAWTNPTTAGKTILVLVTGTGFGGQPYKLPSFTDDSPGGSGSYVLLAASNLVFSGGVSSPVALYACSNSNGATHITMTQQQVGSPCTFECWELSHLVPGPSAGGILSQELRGSTFGFSIPANQVPLGFQIEVTGHQSDQSGSSTLVGTIAFPTGSTLNFSGILPSADGTIFIGTPVTAWNLPLTPGLFNNPLFAVQVQARTTLTTGSSFFVSALKVKVFLSPPPANFNWFATYEQTNAQIDTLALDSNGILYDEQVNYGTGPGTLNSIFSNILPNTFAKGVTFQDIEYIAFSNLLNGTDVPRQWNGTNFDRISMVGPGAACNAAPAGGAGGSNTVSIQTITQAPKVQMRRISWGASINAQSDSTPGNVLVISLPGGSTHGGNQPLNMNIGDTVVLSSITNPFPLKGGGSLPYNLNGTYKITGQGTPIIGGGETDTAFTVQAPATAYGYSNDFGSPPTSGWFYQDCVATVTLQAPLPNVGVGNSIQISGTGGPPAGYDGTWTVLSAPNSSSMTVTQVILVGGIATYTFILAPGSASPKVGQTVTIANVLNGNPAGSPGIFNVTSTIQSVSGSTFTVNISNPDITPAQPQGANQPPATAQVAGTIFTFDATQIINSGNTVTGGSIVQQGLIAIGQRKVCYSFLTRSGFITQPSPISPFNVTSGSGVINVSNLATGPPNVVARIVSFTGANGGNFFYIPQEVDITVPGQPVQINTSTIVNDNTSTTAQFSFSDAVLLSATAIDIPGNNLFNTIELGSCRGLLTYSSRMFAWGEQTKITNLRNLSFDGGVIPGNLAPLGWQLDATNGSGGSLNFSSPVFGWAYQIQNTSGSTQASWGMLEQAAYQDEFGVPIVQASTLYSVRITANCNPVPVSGNLMVDLINSQNGVVLGSFSVPLATMTTNMQIYTGTLLTTILQPVPKTLFIRIWAQNIPNNTTILIDRVEPFQTLTPSFSTALKASYVNNQEAFDLNTGLCGPAQNMQPINGAMTLFDLLYALKEKSWFSTFDNGVTEPYRWNWKEVSEKVGTIGINSFDYGEGWFLTADREGVHFFEGGEPLKISQEIQPLWDAINWQYGYTIWLRNDPEQRRFMVGVPIATPQQAWLPEFPTNTNPTSPNVVLMCNYRELNSGTALAQTGPIRSTYTGRLMSPEPARKWSFWNIQCPYSDYISRANNQWPQWFGTGYQDSKIFQLLQSQTSDDGLAVNSFWVSYGFVKPEMQDAKGLGLYRMEFPYFTVLATGLGTLQAMVYPESPLNQPYILESQALPSISQGDIEIGVNIKGQRFFCRVGTNAVGAAFRCSKMVVPLVADPWSPIRGYNVITA